MQDRAWEGVTVSGTTLDDAAGEAFDKGARLLGLPYPGGAEIDRLARSGDPEAYDFPVARVPGLDFSFSGLKTALLYAVRGLAPAELEARRADLAASYQRAIVRALVERVEAAGSDRVAIVGGVAANSELRASLPDAFAAPLCLCTDNAAMIASAAPVHGPRPGRRVPCARCVCFGVLSFASSCSSRSASPPGSPSATPARPRRRRRSAGPGVVERARRPGAARRRRRRARTSSS